MEYYSTIKQNEIRPFAATWVDQESVILREGSQRSRNVIGCPLYLESKKKWYKWTCLQNRKRLRLRKWTHGYWGEGTVKRLSEGHVHTAIFKMNNQQKPIV